MSASSAGGAMPARRRQQLQAMGIESWRLRLAPAGGCASVTAGSAGIGCIVLVPAGCDTRIRDLLARALQAGGAGLARIGCVSVESAATPLAAAACYLLLDASLEAGLLASYPQAVRHVLSHPAQLLTAVGKRLLWQRLRLIRSQLPAAGGCA